MNDARLREMLRDAESELAESETRTIHLRQVVEGLRGLLGTQTRGAVGAPAVSVESVPDIVAFTTGETAGDAFRNAIKERPNQAVTIADLWTVIAPRLQGGYKAPKNAVNAAARRIAEDKSEPIMRLDDGKYIYSLGAAAGSATTLDFRPVVERVDTTDAELTPSQVATSSAYAGG
ncbi:MAG TPA: hypothetical protein VHW92_11955 [Mycobacteriales bacterium]|jgi:hypothetical protein|nr:hypothetical protein [Mycobacteriales bacterium]